MALDVTIVTPRRKVFQGSALELRAPGWEGEFGVFPGHDLFLSLLRGGILTVVTGSKEETRYVVGRGFVEIGNDRVTVLCDSCELAGDANKDQAAKDLAAAEAAISGTDAWSAEWALAEERMELARARLSA